MPRQALRQRTKHFALEIIAFVRTLANNDTTVEGRLSSSKVVDELLEEANQLSAIFAASRITAAGALRHERQRPSV